MVWKEEGNIGLHFRLCRGKNIHKELKPFRVPHTLQIQDKEGQEECATTTLSDIDEHMDECFTIHLNEEEARNGYGRPKMLVMPSLKNFIIDDTLLISCVFQHSNFK